MGGYVVAILFHLSRSQSGHGLLPPCVPAVVTARHAAAVAAVVSGVTAFAMAAARHPSEHDRGVVAPHRPHCPFSMFMVERRSEVANVVSRVVGPQLANGGCVPGKFVNLRVEKRPNDGLDVLRNINAVEAAFFRALNSTSHTAFMRGI